MKCECGCNQEVKEGNRFIKGHNQRGKHHLPETKQKLSELKIQYYKDHPEANKGENHPMFGKTHSDETKKKMSENQPDQSGENNPMFGRYGEDAPFFGRHHSLETIQKIIENHPDTSRENNPNWKGGISFGHYCEKFNESRKEQIRKEFDYKCFRCDKSQDEQMNEMEDQSKRQFRLSIHHIDFDKDQGCNGKEFMLVPLCTKCHSWTNNHREESQELFIEKLECSI